MEIGKRHSIQENNSEDTFSRLWKIGNRESFQAITH